MADPTEWLGIADRLVGVIDLKAGKAVHAVAGKRNEYQPVSLVNEAANSAPDSPFPPDAAHVRASDGDPAALVRWYRRFGITRFYVADLDSLTDGEVQRESIERLIKDASNDSDALQPDRWLIDVGLRKDVIARHSKWLTSNRFFASSDAASVQWIVASESAESVDVIDTASRHCDPGGLILGVDFRDGRFIGPDKASEPAGVDAWMSRAKEAGINRALLIDVSAVGTGRSDASVSTLRGVAERHPGWRWISGGGCRQTKDVDAYVCAGCDEVLIASALLPKLQPCT
ncbi:HisA/HisF-related TIM barrel protein [Rhodopirellula sallentina]|uniref:HisA/hisF family protein n=1 Tax=Rhodopirellula sallentina SM41 TaxID=1263870 RepID=M5TU85_9BACT|nr:HisA/HisF-related TIM barrel protein [Rhodopirellula sallentina]EMI52624.1 hisA/hisF family protein [Rhodopirellula sallentina SM41]